MNQFIHWPLHPLLFGAVFILQPAALNGVEPPGYIRPLLVVLAVVALTIAVARLATGSWLRGGIAATVLLALAVSREPWIWFATSIRDSVGIGTAMLLLAALLIVAVWGLVLLVRARHRTPPGWLPWTTRALNIFGVVLLTGALLSGGGTAWGWPNQKLLLKRLTLCSHF